MLFKEKIEKNKQNIKKIIKICFSTFFYFDTTEKGSHFVTNKKREKMIHYFFYKKVREICFSKSSRILPLIIYELGENFKEERIIFIQTCTRGNF